ncbi:hypothetical protein LNO14_17530 [Klebsiella pneumoniae subsp. pneumoniae]|nr:hypothetical protein [Klebsiella pneumoniae subsp. pneumoniae]
MAFPPDSSGAVTLLEPDLANGSSEASRRASASRLKFCCWRYSASPPGKGGRFSLLRASFGVRIVFFYTLPKRFDPTFAIHTQQRINIELCTDIAFKLESFVQQ